MIVFIGEEFTLLGISIKQTYLETIRVELLQGGGLKIQNHDTH